MFPNFIKKSKLSYEIYNLFNKSRLKHNIPLFKKYGINKKYYASISSLDFKGIDNEINIFDKLDSKTELPKNEFFKTLDSKIQDSLLSWSENGYVVLKNYYSSDEVDAFNTEVAQLIQTKKAKWRYNRILFANKISKLIHNAGTDKKLTGILSMLLGREVSLFQSLNFIKGSQQRPHSDSIHMTTFPTGNLIAVWIALEDTTLENGLLHYYPGSHKLPYILNEAYDNIGTKTKLGNKNYCDYEDKIEEVLKENNLKKEVFLAKKGDLLIWHANLIHGGEPVLDKNATRKSMVFHYYAKNVICYHEITQRPTLR